MKLKQKVGIAGALLAALAVGLVLAMNAFGRADRHALVVEVHVTFTDTNLAVAPGSLTSQLASFDVALVVVNKGKKAHVLTIKGPGLSGSPTKAGTRFERVPPGGSTTMRLKLLTGAYSLSDPAGLGQATVRWLVIHPATAGHAGKTKGSPGNTAFPPGETSTNSWMECAI